MAKSTKCHHYVVLQLKILTAIFQSRSRDMTSHGLIGVLSL